MNSEKLKRLGTSLKRVRESKGLTQQDMIEIGRRLSRDTGTDYTISMPTISKYESGQQDDVKIKTLLTICTILGINMLDLLDDVGLNSVTQEGIVQEEDTPINIAVSYLMNHPEVYAMILNAAKSEDQG